MENNNEKSEFRYTYSAKEREELKKIREKYTHKDPPEESKMERLRRLDRSVTKKAQTVSWKKIKHLYPCKPYFNLKNFVICRNSPKLANFSLFHAMKLWSERTPRRTFVRLRDDIIKVTP